MDSFQKPTLAAKYKTLPQAIRDWFDSDTVINVILELNGKFEIYGKKAEIIPQKITQLILKILPPENFSASIKEPLSLNDQELTQIVDEIKTKILDPIAAALKTTENIDIDAIKISQRLAPAALIQKTDSLAQQRAKKPDSAATQVRPGVVNLSVKTPTSTPGALADLSKQSHPTPAKPTTETEKKSLGDALIQRPEQKIAKAESQEQISKAEHPFMLHEEIPQAPSAQGGQPKEDFSFEIPSSPKKEKESSPAKFGNYFSGLTKQVKPEAKKAQSKKEQNPRIVHYSAYRTILGDKDKK